MGIVDFVAVLPLGEESVTINGSHHFHGTLIVAIGILKKSFADPGAVAPEDGPEVVNGITGQLLIVEKTADTWSGSFATVDLMGASASVTGALHLALEIAPEFVQARGDFASFAKIVVIDQSSSALELSHEAVGTRLIVPPPHILVKKVAYAIGEVTIFLTGISGGDQCNCMVKTLDSIKLYL